MAPVSLNAADRSIADRWQAALEAQGIQSDAEVPDAPPLFAARQAGISPEAEARAVAGLLSVAFLEDLNDRHASAEFVEQIPIGFARQHEMIALAEDAEELPVAIATVGGWEQLDVVSRFLGRPVRPLFAPAKHIHAAINAAYQERGGQAQQLIDSLDEQEVLAELQQLDSREDLLDVADRAPVIRLVNLILFEAVKSEASDVHIQPYEDRLVARLRIDGVLFDAFDVPKGLQEEVLSRIKVIGRMNIAEKRLPQDGRATVQVGDRLIDLRIASLPTSFGERIVLRLLDKSARLYGLDELGMDAGNLQTFSELVRLEHGMILVTGPTGSGKSTTLYAVLQEIDTKDRNVLTLEDPIEYQLDGVSQTQINEKKGMTFASGLRSVLRQDPDIVMLGEIRDRDTAVMAIQASLTGHLVFSTLHTNDAASAVTRLLDLGIEPYLAASSVVGVLAQRLVRRNCPACSVPYVPSETERLKLGLAADRELLGARRGAGCSECRETGYRGRVGIFELLVVDDAIRERIHARDHASQIRTAALKCRMSLLREDGIAKVEAGITTAEEVARVTVRAEL